MRFELTAEKNSATVAHRARAISELARRVCGRVRKRSHMIDPPDYVVVGQQMVRPAALEELYDGIYEKAIAVAASDKKRQKQERPSVAGTKARIHVRDKTSFSKRRK